MIDISTTEEEQQKILHMLYCNTVGHVANSENFGRLNTRNGLNHVKEHFDADEFYLCKDFRRGLFRRMARKETIKETDNSNTPDCVAQAHSVEEVNLNTTAVSPTAITVGSTSPTDSSAQAADINQTPNTSILRRNLRRSPRNHSKACPRQLAPEAPDSPNEPLRKKRSATEVARQRFEKISGSYRDGNKKTYRKKLSEIGKKYYNERVDTALCQLLCISGVQPDENLEKNKYVFDEVMDLLSSLKARLIHKTKLTVTSSAREVESVPIPIPAQVEDDTTTSRNSTLPARHSSNEIKKIKEVETRLLARLPRDEFNNIMQMLNEREEKKIYSSHHALSKNLPPCSNIEVEYVALNPRHNPDTEAGRREPLRINVVGKGVTTDTTDAIRLLMKRTEDIVLQVDGLTIEKALEDCFVIYCFDGAVHENTSQVNKNVITYSLTLGSYNLVKFCGVFPTSGNNILPFAQLHASECKETIGKIMEQRLANALGTDTYGGLLTPENYVYDLADSKAFYAMLNHTGWASKYHSYLICECEKGDSLRNENRCKLITNERYKQLYNNSHSYFSQQTRKQAQDESHPSYTNEMHKTWCSIHNSGMTHRHFLPLTYNVEGIRFDIFHGRSGTLKIMIGYIRTLLDNNYNALGKFKQFLGKLDHWDDYVIDQFLSGDTNTRLKGKHTKCFIKRADDVISELRKLLDEVDIAEFCICLKSFQKMSEIISIVFIDEYNTVKHLLPAGSTITETSEPAVIAEAIFKEYENNAKLLFTNGFLSFMERNDGSGAGESFYLHVLRHYMPHHMRVTYQRHRLGIAIFSMEGFEYKNYTSKYVMRNRNNGRGVQAKQSLKVLQLLYVHSCFDVQKEKKKHNLT